MALRLTITRDMLRKCLAADTLGITDTSKLEFATRDTWDRLAAETLLAPPAKEWEVTLLDSSTAPISVKADEITTDDHGNLVMRTSAGDNVAIFSGPFNAQIKRPAAE